MDSSRVAVYAARRADAAAGKPKLHWALVLVVLAYRATSAPLVVQPTPSRRGWWRGPGCGERQAGQPTRLAPREVE